ncbi:MAG: sporulation protein YqfD [Candidatus Improbicoccus pseudotrichonymphae]|uniref:Sporulation protein YqfD n=1 Tax=Candidatus Improbicoccus pseudotrichonymphae TaxID=3033792 RepID=A0AA48HY13_9FIRM|nr:MAG: sporulation protein YqfD [Candidatus Improbicoccus pseudotrichonymphae]
MILKIIRWIFGYETFFVKSKDLVNFINVLNRNKIILWDILKIEETLYFKSDINQHFHILKIAKNTRSEIGICAKKGLPFVWKRYKKRFGIVIGILFFLIFINILSLFVWNIKINGLKNLEKTKINGALKEINIKPGVLRKSIDASLAKQLIMEKIPEISWISINIDGSIVDISIKEKENAPEIIDQKIFPNQIRASRNGQIEKLEVYQGKPIVKVGDSVTKGQILIDASEFSNNKSEGKVWAKTIHQIREKINILKNVDVETDNFKNIYKLCFLNKNINLKFWEKIPENWGSNRNIKKFKIFNKELPFKLIKEHYFEKKQTQIKVSKEEAIEQCKRNIYHIINSEEFKEIKIIDKNEKIIKQKNEEFLEMTLKCFENIAE